MAAKLKIQIHYVFPKAYSVESLPSHCWATLHTRTKQQPKAGRNFAWVLRLPPYHDVSHDLARGRWERGQELRRPWEWGALTCTRNGLLREVLTSPTCASTSRKRSVFQKKKKNTLIPVKSLQLEPFVSAHLLWETTSTFWAESF